MRWQLIFHLKNQSMKNSPCSGLQWVSCISLLAGILFSFPLHAQFPYIESFRNASAPGMSYCGSAFLTAGIHDPVGYGYLRVTDSSHDQAGSANSTVFFNSNQGLIAEFEYFAHDGIPFPVSPAGNTGDGFCFFLYNGDLPFQIGASGGSLH